MKHEVTLKRADGTRIFIKVELGHVHFCGDRPVKYHYTVHTCAKGKRTRKSACDETDWDYRKADNRDQYHMAKLLEVVSAEELHAAALELWQRIKPPSVTTLL